MFRNMPEIDQYLAWFSWFFWDMTLRFMIFMSIDQDLRKVTPDLRIWGLRRQKFWEHFWDFWLIFFWKSWDFWPWFSWFFLTFDYFWTIFGFFMIFPECHPLYYARLVYNAAQPVSGLVRQNPILEVMSTFLAYIHMVWSKTILLMTICVCI